MHWQRVFILGLVAVGTTSSFAQDPGALQRTAHQFEQQFVAEASAASFFAARYGIPLRTEAPGKTTQLVRVAGGRPQYLETLSNFDAARSSLTNSLWPQGDLGLALTGNGLTLGIWDGGTVRTTHVELRNRVTLGDTEPMDAHATHVGGTMIASGVMPVARGMAYMARLSSFGWTNDRSEMATAASRGMTISNHSYGLISGWAQSGGRWLWYGNPSLSATEDATFGYYGATASAWDTIAFQAPNYLIVKAAGNDRRQGPAPGTPHLVWGGRGWVESTATRLADGGQFGYDCLPQDSTGKNILVVGAAEDFVTTRPSGAAAMTSFSSWGPTDDGRIKPDISANGSGLTSPVSNSDTSYGTWSGTSMASPTAAGTIALLGQHFRNVLGTQPRSATMRALVIHSADDIGSAAGPDYAFGWGYLNARSAAQVISRDVQNPITIQELSLRSGTTYSINVPVTTGSLSVTLAWTDPVGAPRPLAFNNRTPILVNDLDVRVAQGTQTFLPWRLNPASPASAAERGDNRVDNVERIDIPVASGTYTVTVRAKNATLAPSGQQPFTLIITQGQIPGQIRPTAQR